MRRGFAAVVITLGVVLSLWAPPAAAHADDPTPPVPPGPAAGSGSEGDRPAPSGDRPAPSGERPAPSGERFAPATERRVPGLGRLRVQPARPMAGERATYRSRVPGGGLRPVFLQRRAGGRWVTLARDTSSGDGTVYFTARLRSATVVRIFAPTANLPGFPRAAFVGRAERVRLAPQRVRMTAPPTGYVGEQLVVTGTAKPGRNGRRVALQARSAGRWVNVEVGRQNRRGRVTFRITASDAGDHRVRLRALAYKGAAKKASRPASLRVSPSEVTVSEDTHVLETSELETLLDADPASGTLTFAGTPDTPDLEVGEYLPLLPSDALPDGGLFAVTGVTRQGSGGLVVRTRPAALPEIVEHVPDDFDGFAPSTLSTTIGDLPDGVVLEEDGARSTPSSAVGLASIDAPEIRLRYDREVQQNGTELALKGTLRFTPGLDFEFRPKFFRPADWRVGAHIDYDVTLEASAAVKTEFFSYKLPLPQVRRVFGFSIGPVPVVLTSEVGPEISLEATGKIGFKTSATVTGARTVGMQRRDGRVSFYNNGGETTQVSPIAPYAAGEVTLFGGLDGDVYAYGLVGPYFRGGYELVGEAEVSTGGFSCSLYHRPVLEWGVRTAEVLEKLFGYSESETFGWDFPKNTIAECGTTPPEINTQFLPEADVGEPYLFRLSTADNRPGRWGLAPTSDRPWWLTLNPDNGVLSGTPGPGDAGVSVLEITFRDGQEQLATKTFVLVVNAPAECYGPFTGDETLYISAGDYVWVTLPETDWVTTFSGRLSWGDGATTPLSVTGAGGYWEHTYHDPGFFRVQVTGTGTLYDGRPCVYDSGFNVSVS